MSGKNVRAENATIRPFRNIGAATIALDPVRLTIDGDEEKAGPVVVAPETLLWGKFTLTLPDLEDVQARVAETMLHVPDCGLVIVATGRSHRGASRVIYMEHLDKADYPTEFFLHRQPGDLVLSDRQGFTITVALVLLVDYQTWDTLRPHMAGTWLARRDFKVSVERDQTSFSPEELTDQVRTDNDLPEGVMRFIQYTSVVGAEDISEVVRVYVDPTVLNWLYANETRPAALQLQTELAVQAYSVAAASMVDEIRFDIGAEPGPGDLGNYPVAEHLFEFITHTLTDATGKDVTISEVLKYTKTPGLLASHLEVAFKMRDSTLHALKEN